MPINTATGSEMYDEALNKNARRLSRAERRVYLRKSAKAARRYLRVHPGEAEPEPSAIAVGSCGYCKKPIRLHGGPDLTICPIGVVNGMGVTLS